MFKLLVLSVFIAVAAAAPSGLYHEAPIAYESVAVVEPEYHVGAVVEHIPTAVSHQSRTDYHSKPVVHSVLAPVVHAAPAVHAAPVAYSAPIYSSYAHSAPVYSTYAHSAPIYSSSPLISSW
ncbi:hypothetical protein HA402_014938 [Bradysia odoriphaga]|nr:hypothetical protein HA402_014938 [Bradysia odoriphaga]